MSLSVEHLTRTFGRQRAVDDISFEVREGEIVGFLGPNGAGKSTTMRILTGYLPPTAGRAKVLGYDTIGDALQVKRLTGYLPESSPLYGDMYVHEYLRFTGALHGLAGRYLRERVVTMVERCGLTPEQNKRIENLSKGYRQRVGLAQALIHEPRVLILDEPTSGLDPNQIVEVRNLIREVSRNKTVLFSTHIMQEVEALCDRVIVIHRGRIVADDQLRNLLRRREGQAAISVDFDSEPDLGSLAELPGVLEVSRKGKCSFQLLTGSANAKGLQQTLFMYAAEHGLTLTGFRVDEHSLERVFNELTTSSPDDSHSR